MKDVINRQFVQMVHEGKITDDAKRMRFTETPKPIMKKGIRNVEKEER